VTSVGIKYLLIAHFHPRSLKNLKSPGNRTLHLIYSTSTGASDTFGFKMFIGLVPGEFYSVVKCSGPLLQVGNRNWSF